MNKKVIILIAAALCLVVMCAAGWPLLKEYGKSARIEKSEGGTVSIQQSLFDPASYRHKTMNYRVQYPEANLGDPEAEIMTVFEELANIETSPFKYYDGDEEISDIGNYRIDIGESIKMVGPWSEFTLTREDENTFTMIDSAGYGFTYYIYPLTGDTVMKLDYTPVGFILPPDGKVKIIENGAADFTVKHKETVVIGEETETHKKGDRVRFTIKFKDVPEELVGEYFGLGFYLNPSDPMGETEGPGYREGDGWFYPLEVTVDKYETVLEYPLSYSGEYRFCLCNYSVDANVEVESFSVEVIPAE